MQAKSTSSDEERNALRYQLHMQLLRTAARLRALSDSRVAADAYFLIEAGASALVANRTVRTVPKITDRRVRSAGQVLMGGQPGKDLSARIRIVATLVANLGRRSNRATILAPQLDAVDAAFRRLSEDEIESVLRKTRSSTAAVVDLLIAARALGVKADAADDPKEKRKVRDRVDKALREKA